MANTNFLQFDPQAMNMLDDENYLADAQRVSGVSTGLARSLLYNKQAFQTSTMAVALANVMVVNGKDAMDNNLASLTENLLNTFVTTGQNNTFTGDNAFAGVLYKKLDAVLGTTPSEDKLAAFGVHDGDGTWLGGWEHFYNSDGSIGKQISVRKQDGNGWAQFTIGYDGSQNEFVSASSGVKSGMVNWGMPNYSASVAINSGYQTTSNGVIKVRHLEWKDAKLYVNGALVYNHTWSGGDFGSQYQESFIQVPKSKTVTFENMETVQFLPCYGG